MIIENEDFLFESINKMAKDYFLFFEVTEDVGYNSEIQEVFHRKGDVIIINNYSIESREDGYYVGNVNIKSLGNVVGMFDKCFFPKTPNFSATESYITDECPLPIQYLEKLIDDNYIAVEFIDGSKGWVDAYEKEFYGEPSGEILLNVHFGDDSFEFCLSSNIKKIVSIKPKK
ncbi:hypothetical protein [Gilliamella sp. BG6]|uniref:hypothetical protein n=1 Tax=unclassified Gilliamella TaxID=2685620 RepID=UPI003987B45F